MSIDEAIVHAREIAEEQRVKKRTCGNCKYCKKSYIHPRQGYCYFNAIHYEHDLTQKACSDWESNDDIGCECAEEQEQIAEWLEELKAIKKWKSEIISEFAKYDATCADEIYQKGRNFSIGEYSNNAHNRIMYDLTDIMADLNEKEIKCHDDIDEWLKVWKREVIRMIWHSMCEVRFEIEQKMKEGAGNDNRSDEQDDREDA